MRAKLKSIVILALILFFCILSTKTVKAETYGLYSVTFPESLKTIGIDAFSDCYALKEIAFSNSMEKILDCAFENCQSLSKVYIPASVTGIGVCTFMGHAGGFEIHGVAGTEAENYAAAQRITFVEHTTHTNEKYITPADANKKTDGIAITKCSLCGKVSSTEIISYPAKIVLSDKSFVYDGTERIPTVTVKRFDTKVIY